MSKLLCALALVLLVAGPSACVVRARPAVGHAHVGHAHHHCHGHGARRVCHAHGHGHPHH
jgi:hypothetical protein